MKVWLLLLITLILISGCSVEKGDRELKGEYLGFSLPHDSSEVFAPDIVSTEYNVRDATFSPDGNEFFYSIRGASFIRSSDL